MSEKIEPAMTPEGWASLDEGDGDDTWENGTAEQMGRHAAAARALRNQPFGFTRADTAMLYGLASGWEREDPERLKDLADRIAALLPPREPGA